MTSHTLTLADSRVLSYRTGGDPNGFPLIWHHGTPGANSFLRSFEEACERKHVRLISYSRQGYGDSSRQVGRKVVDVVPVVEALRKELGVEKFVTAGWSGGGSHALATGARIPDCLAVLCIAGGAPFEAEGLDWMAGQGQDNIDEYKAAFKGLPELETFCGALRNDMISATAAGIVQALSSILPPVDKTAILSDPHMGDYFVDGTKEGLKHGVDGWVDDDMAFINPWGFDLKELEGKPVFQYQGSEDLMVPYAHGVWLGKHLPQKSLVNHLEDGEGHVSIFTNNVDKMIDELLGVAGGERA